MKVPGSGPVASNYRRNDSECNVEELLQDLEHQILEEQRARAVRSANVVQIEIEEEKKASELPTGGGTEQVSTPEFNLNDDQLALKL